MTDFSALGLVAPILRALTEDNLTLPTAIQTQAIPQLLAGRDLLGIAQTGTGKTAAFGLPILQRLNRTPRRAGPKRCRALILSPTRELATQICSDLESHGRHLPLSTRAAIGGVPIGRQIRALASGADILVATPGRLEDLSSNGHLRLDQVEILVLDEADQMLDMGFIHAIRRIARALPPDRQNLFFSATMPRAIAGLAAELLRDPVRVEVTPVATPVERIQQDVIMVDTKAKRELLTRLFGERDVSRALVFTRTKHGADRVSRHLNDAGISADAIHGNKSQGQRERALQSFRTGRLRALVATDIAARGIHVEGVTHVINFEIPNVPETYVHRIGRTARAGADGMAISLCNGEERSYLRDIETLIRQRIPALMTDGTALQNQPSVTSSPGVERGPRPAGTSRRRNRRRRQTSAHAA